MSCCKGNENCCEIKEEENTCKKEIHQGIKSLVQDEYSKIANQSKDKNEKSCCGIGVDCSVDYTVFSEDYTKLDGYCKTADLGLGCGIPTKSIKIVEGDIVLDLGCGAGNDCFVARKLVGSSGKVIGLDMTLDMLKKAWINNDKMGYNNVEFRLGDIENMPIADGVVDKVISNCVINLVPDKGKAFKEIHRVLKKDGMFSISDIVTTGELPEGVKSNPGLYAGCVSGAITKEDYINKIENVGFKTTIIKEKEGNIPDDILQANLSKEEYMEFKSSQVKILSITVIGQKV